MNTICWLLCYKFVFGSIDKICSSSWLFFCLVLWMMKERKKWEKRMEGWFKWQEKTKLVMGMWNSGSSFPSQGKGPGIDPRHIHFASFLNGESSWVGWPRPSWDHSSYFYCDIHSRNRKISKKSLFLFLFLFLLFYSIANLLSSSIHLQSFLLPVSFFQYTQNKFSESNPGYFHSFTRLFFPTFH